MMDRGVRIDRGRGRSPFRGRGCSDRARSFCRPERVAVNRLRNRRANGRHQRVAEPTTAHPLQVLCEVEVQRPSRPVLVVEDDPDVQAMVRLFLESEGFSVCSAQDAVAALESLNDNKPSLILLDVNMPRMDGITFVRRLRTHSDPDIARTPIVLVTALAGARAAAEAIDVADVIVKPISFDKVVSAVEQHCGPAH